MGKIIGKTFPLYATPEAMPGAATIKTADMMALLEEQKKHLSKMSRAELDVHAAAEGVDTTGAKNKDEAIALIVTQITPECTGTWPRPIAPDSAQLPLTPDETDPDAKYLQP